MNVSVNVSVVPNTNEAPQSKMGRFNKVIGGFYQDATVFWKWMSDVSEIW